MGGFEIFFKDLGGQIEISFTPDNVGDVINNTVNKASSTFINLIDMLPMVLIAGGALFLLTKKLIIV